MSNTTQMPFQTAQQQSDIKWQQIICLAALDAAIIISWIAYHNYQPKLLTNFGFTHLTFFLVAAKSVVLFLMPPIAGYIADHLRRKNGTRLAVITSGVSLTAMIFMAVASLIALAPTGGLRLIFPFMIVLWLISMNIFHSPALSMIEMFAPKEKLTKIMAIFTVVADLLFALEPSVIELIDFLGAPATFITGGVLVGVSGYYLKKFSEKLPQTNNDEPAEHEARTSSNFAGVLLVSALAGVATALLFNYFPDWLAKNLDLLANYGIQGNFVVSGLLIISAIVAVPLGNYAEKVNLQNLFFGAILATLALGAGVYFSSNIVTVIMAILFAVALSASAVCGLPWAFSQLSSKHKVLGIGVFFSGLELAGGISDILQAL